MFVLANSEHVRVPPSWLQMLGTAKLAGGIGLMIGLLGGRPVGLLAAIGRILFFLGAVARHIQTRVYYNIAFPRTFLLLSIVCVRHCCRSSGNGRHFDKHRAASTTLRECNARAVRLTCQTVSDSVALFMLFASHSASDWTIGPRRQQRPPLPWT